MCADRKKCATASAFRNVIEFYSISYRYQATFKLGSSGTRRTTIVFIFHICMHVKR